MKKIFYLSRLINRELKKEATASALAQKIKLTNADAEEPGSIGRRTLLKLAKQPGQVKLSYTQLVALDNFLAHTNEGLDRIPLFLKTGLIDWLGETPRVAFLLGSTPRASEQRNDLSRWDTRSVADLLQQICLRSAEVHWERPNVSFQIEDVLLDLPAEANKFAAEKWYALLRDQHCSVISIGSPRACHASELMLAQMFGVTPFESPAHGEAQLPFCFFWPDTEPGESGLAPKKTLKRNPEGFRSHFALGADALGKNEAKLAQAVRRGKSCGFRFEHQFYDVTPGPKPFKMYAMIAAQRRADGQLHVVIAGISGPATHAAAMLLKKITSEIPRVQGQDSPVLYAPVEAIISVDPAPRKRGDNRKVDSCRLLAEPKEWKPPASAVPKRSP